VDTPAGSRRPFGGPRGRSPHRLDAARGQAGPPVTSAGTPCAHRGRVGSV